MKWTDEKLELLVDEYAYCDLKELSEKIGCTVKALTRKAEKLRLFRAKNNEVKDGIKYCTYCHTYHEVEDNFYKNRTKNSNLEYACKLYFEKFKLKNIRKIASISTTPLKQKRGNQANRGDFEVECNTKVKNRPINPVVIKNGVEGKICNGCKVWKPLDAYGIDKKGIAGRRARCISCMRERNKQRKNSSECSHD